MKKKSVVLAVELLGILLLSERVAGLKCYICNSKEDSRCLEPLDETNGLQLMNCTSDEQQRLQTRKAIEEISELMAKLGQSGSVPLSTKKASQVWEEEKFPVVCQKLELSGEWGHWHCSCKWCQKALEDPVTPQVEGNPVIGRGCSAPRMENFDPCYAVKLITSKDIVLKSCSLCDTDGCNGGDRIRASVLTVVAVVLGAGALNVELGST